MESVCFKQKQMEVLFDGKHATVSEHIKNIFTSGELNGLLSVFPTKVQMEGTKKASEKSRVFKLLFKMVERENHSQKSSDCPRPPKSPLKSPPKT